MLTIIREHAQSWIVAVIIGLLSLSFALWGIQYYTNRHHHRPLAAKVYDRPITEASVRDLYGRLRNRWIATLGRTHNLTPKVQHQLRQQALNELINRHLLAHAVDDLHFQIAPEVVDDIIRSIPAFHNKQGQFDAMRFHALLRRTGFSEQQFIQNLESSLLAHQLRQGILRSAFVLPDELADARRLLLQTRSAHYLRFPIAQFAAGISVTKAMAEHYYEENKVAFKAPEKVRLAYVRLSAKTLASRLKVSEQELRTFYANNIDLYTPRTKNKKATTPHPRPFKKVRATVKQAVLRQKVEQAFSERAEQLADLSYTNPDSLEPVAKALTLRIQATPWFTREQLNSDNHSTRKQGIINNPKIIAAAFSHDVLTDGNNSRPIQLQDGSLIVLRVKERQPALVPPFKKLYPQVVAKLRKELAVQKAKVLAMKVVDDIKQGQLVKADRLARQYNLLWHEASHLKHAMPKPTDFLNKKQMANNTNKSFNDILTDSAFRLTLDDKQSSVMMQQLNNGDYLVVALQHIHIIPASAATQNSRYTKLKKQWAQSMGELEYKLYVKALKDKAKLQIYAKETANLADR